MEIHWCVSRRAGFRWFPNAGAMVPIKGTPDPAPCDLTFGDWGSIFGRLIGLGVPFKIARR